VLFYREALAAPLTNRPGIDWAETAGGDLSRRPLKRLRSKISNVNAKIHVTQVPLGLVLADAI
jgi:hypothetical protein